MTDALTGEAARLQALHSYHILDTPAEQRFDRITKLLARSLGVPMALISLIDVERQWFKAKVGVEGSSTSRELAFCSHAIESDDPLVVEDALEDRRFANNPMVTQAPHIRFYAGAPLITPEGFRLGTLCAIDQKPRTLDAEDRQLLKELSEHVMDLFELRRLTSLKRAVEDTTQALSHDLRPSLHQIKTFSELIASEPANSFTPRSRRHLQLIQEVSERTRNRLDVIRDFFKVGEDRRVLTIPTADVVRLVLNRLEPLVKERQAEVTVDQLPAVLGSRNEIEALFTHLFDNALKYVQQLPAKVSLHASQRAERVLFELRDNGPGIPEAQRNRATRLFQRLHGGEIPGQGAGLALCQRIVEISGGKLWFDTAPEGGTIVRFTLPAASLTTSN